MEQTLKYAKAKEDYDKSHSIKTNNKKEIK